MTFLPHSREKESERKRDSEREREKEIVLKEITWTTRIQGSHGKDDDVGEYGKRNLSGFFMGVFHCRLSERNLSLSLFVRTIAWHDP